MFSKEILWQYMIGAIKPRQAISALEKLLTDTSSSQKLQEAARARYVIGLIHRIRQYKSGEASVNDLCLNIRDVVLFMGQIRLTECLYTVVKKHGQAFDLICEEDLQVSCLMHFPNWAQPEQYIRDVYSFSVDYDQDIEMSSAGDDILRTHTVFRSYKSFEQKLAVHSALKLSSGYTLLISQPTGGGKSLVTQVLSSYSDGLTVVIVPTVALALDQYHAAKSNLKNCDNIYCYRGGQTAEERISIVKSLSEKRAKLLFTSPEAIFKNQELYALLEHSAEEKYLTNVVLDEAHVVPDWGVFFRPDFQVFSIALKKWRLASGNHIRTYLLSATLSDEVVSTLFSLFGDDGRNCQIRCDALRQEPRFYFRAVKSSVEQSQKVLEAAQLLPKPMVIYVLEPREARDLQKCLQGKGYKNIPIFTGETKETERNRVLLGWKNNEFDIVVATSAFGIGVDKPDVRTIIHACCPENLSRFYQEVGRAGRDHLPAISLFIPYQSQYDKEGDVRRALGLVNKRVLTVERSIIRWNGMLNCPGSMVYGDESILDTSATPASMTDEEAEYAGNRNVAWNVNLLLFLHRTGFISLTNAKYVPDKKAYLIYAKVLQPEILNDSELFAQGLVEPRERECRAQMQGYNAIRDLVASPKSTCWGRVFRQLFPYSREVCNGCPADIEGRFTTDSQFKLRIDTGFSLPPSMPSKRLRRSMGSYSEMIVRREKNGPCTTDEAYAIAAASENNQLGAIVLPDSCANNVPFNGLILNYEEFFFATEHTPYLFAGGVICVFDGDLATNLALYKGLCKLEQYDYRRVIYCNENMPFGLNGKPLRECFDANIIAIARF